MYGQSVAGFWIMRMAAALAFVAPSGAEFVPELLGPARRISAFEFAHIAWVSAIASAAE